MAGYYWIGGARTIQQVTTVTIGSSTNGHVFTILLQHPSGHSSITPVEIATYTAGGAETTTTIATALLALLQASKHEYSTAISWTSNGADIIYATAAVAGVPFIVTETGSGTITIATTTANSGPTDASVASNYRGGAAPTGTSNNLYVTGQYSILYGYATLQGSTSRFANVKIFDYRGTLGWIGAPVPFCMDNSGGSISIDTFGTAYVEVQSSNATNPSMHVINAPAGSTNNGVYLSCASNGVGLFGINSLRVTAGSVRIMATTDESDTPTISRAIIESGGVLEVPAGSLVTTYDIVGGVVYHSGTSTTTTLSMNAGEFYTYVSGAITTANINGGYFESNSTGTIGTLNANGGWTNFLNNRQSRTVTTLNQAQAAIVDYDTAFMTITTFTRTGPMRSMSAVGNGNGSNPTARAA